MISTYVKLGGNEMLRASVEIISGNDGRPIPIGVLEADNVGGDEHYGDYNLRLFQHSNTGTTVRRAELKEFRRGRGAFALVREALKVFSQ
jgi:hypothetical protein